MYFAAIQKKTVSQKKKSAPPKIPGKAPEQTPINEKQNNINEKQTPATPKAGKIPGNPVTGFFDTLGNKGPFVALGLIIFIGIIIFRDFLIFDKLYFFKDIGDDTLNYSYPYAHNVAEYIANHGLPKWSFNLGIGQNLFPFLLRDPFDIILYIAGKDHFVYATIYKELIKIVLGGYTFYYYLRTIKLSEYSAIIGGILFAYSGFMIVGSGWYIFSFESFNIALLLLAFEQLFTKQKWFLFLFAIFLVCISQPFNLYIYGIFLVVYVFFRYLQAGVFSWKNIGIMFLRMAGLGAIALFLSGPFMLENVVQLLESPRGSGNTSYANIFIHAPMFAVTDVIDMGISVMRFFSSDMLGNGSDFIKGIPSNSNYLEGGLFYCGLPSLILMPQIFPFLRTRVRIVFIVAMSLWIIPIIFPYFRYAFWLFTGNYYRDYCLMVAIFFMFYSLQALDLVIQKQKINVVILVITVIALFALLNYPYFPDKEIINTPIFAFVSAMIVIYAVLLFFMGRKNSPVYLRYIFIFLVVLEVTYLTNITVNGRDALQKADLTSKVKGYNDYTLEALNYINTIDHSFFRVDKVYGSSPASHYSINDGMAQGYRGTSSYNSFNELSYILYLQLIGISHKDNELQSRFAVGPAYRPILETENQVKYLLSKGPINYISRNSSDSLTSFGDVRIYRNKYVLPLGYTYDHFIKESTYTQLSNDQKDYVSLRACVLRDEDVNKAAGLTEFQLRDTVSVFSFALYKEYTDSLKKDTLTTTHFGETLVQGKINLHEDKMMYLSIPYDKGWTLEVDGRARDKIVLSAGMTGIMLTKGAHEIEMSYELRFFKYGVYLSIIGLLLLGGLWFYLGKRKDIPENNPVL